ncbi:two-component regulator propeller domain-containing protein [Aquincola sp. MAHUQ-54]|uniref:histidine kinase n=1 Tax=Aquincola agrisoli TaxID=3119538 RepID=A0AAW9QBT5_9BURK
MRRVLRHAAALLACGVAVACGGLPAAWGGDGLPRFEQLGPREGLPPLAVSAIAQDVHGQVWLGTAAGLLRYDGRRVTPLQDLSTPSSRMVFALHPDDARQRLWVGSEGGLDVLDLRTDLLQAVPPPAALRGQRRRVVSVQPGPPGALWVLFGRGDLYRLDAASLAWTAQPIGGSGNPGARWPAWTMAPDGQGGVWVPDGGVAVHVAADGRVRRRLHTVERSPRPGAQPAAAIRALALDGEGRLWVSNGRGLQIWRGPDGDAPVRDPVPVLPRCGQAGVSDLLRDRRGDMWVHARGRGLCRWQQGRPAGSHVPVSPMEASQGLAEPVSTLYQGRDGALWVGTWNRGVAHADLGAMVAVRHVHSAAEAAVLSASENVAMLVPWGADEVLVGSYAGDLRRLDLRSGRWTALPRGLRGVGLRSSLRTASGEVWLGSETDGLYRLDLRTGALRRHGMPSRGPRMRAINALAMDRSGALWVGTNAGLERLDAQGGWQGFGPASGIDQAVGGSVVNAVLALPDGEVLVGGRMGLRAWTPAAGRFSSADTPGAVEVLKLHRDDAGRIWVGAIEGLFEAERSGGRWRLVAWNELPGLPVGAGGVRNVTALQADAQGQLWVLDAHGAFRVDPARRTARRFPDLLGADAGTWREQAARLADGRVLIGGTGVHVFHPGEVRPPAAAPGVALSALSLFNRPATAAVLQALGVGEALRHARRITLSHDQNVVGFEFAALQPGPADRVRYAWRLEGFDAGWNQAGPGPAAATYTNLDPGDYVLAYRASLDGGSWTPEPGRLEITVLPPFWRTWWWAASMALLGLAVLGSAYHLRVRSLQQARLRLEQEVAARTREVLAQQASLAEEKAEADRQREAAEAAQRHIGALSELGRDIMASLDTEAIHRTLCAGLCRLMPARQVRVLRSAADAPPPAALTLAFAWEQGVPVRPVGPVADPASLAQRCLRSGEAGVASRRAGEPLLGPDAPAWARAALLAPLGAHGRTIGVIVVFGEATEAFGPVQLDMLRALAGHLAGALSNAEAYERLRFAQARLVEREKMAALGSLVAGVAHELNTPLGNGVLLATTLQDEVRRFAGDMARGGLRRSALQAFIGTMERSAELLLSALNGAATLVRSFKQVAVDQTADLRRPFELHALCEELAATLASRLKPQQHVLAVDVPEGIRMDGYPGSLGQVLSNLILNAAQHGFEGRTGGRMHLRAERPDPQQVRLVFTDDGAGIPAEHLPRIFEPFFTTRLGRGGSGLGLSISYNIVTALLGGRIAASSPPGQGARFELVLPLVAPARTGGGGREPGAA